MPITTDDRNTYDGRRVAEAVRTACIETALAAYERASTDGLCAAGAWECAIDAIRALDLTALLQRGR